MILVLLLWWWLLLSLLINFFTLVKKPWNLRALTNRSMIVWFLNFNYLKKNLSIFAIYLQAESKCNVLNVFWCINSLISQLVKHLPTIQETLVLFLGQEDLLKGYATHSSILGFQYKFAGRESTCNVGDLGSIPGLGRFPWRREGLSTLVLWPGEFHGLYSPLGHKESHTTEPLSLS